MGHKLGELAKYMAMRVYIPSSMALLNIPGGEMASSAHTFVGLQYYV